MSIRALLRYRWILIGVTALALICPAALALDAVNKTRRGVALEGYDPVAYFTEGHPSKGSAELTLEWNGAEWRFASVEHRELFAADPQRYAPQYGGYCAKAVSEGSTAGIDPRAWKIVDGKLYLNYSLKIQRVWERDIPDRIARGDAAWPGLLAGD